MLKSEEMVNSPAKWLLLLLLSGGLQTRYNEPVAGRTKLMKELFLLMHQEGVSKPWYSFEPSHYGPSSSGVLRDLATFQTLGLIQYDRSSFGGSYSLTPVGLTLATSLQSSIKKPDLQKIRAIKERYNLAPLNRLLHDVYTRFPAFTEKSVIRDQVLRNPDEE